jgi:hypothetical protein
MRTTSPASDHSDHPTGVWWCAKLLGGTRAQHQSLLRPVICFEKSVIEFFCQLFTLLQYTVVLAVVHVQCTVLYIVRTLRAPGRRDACDLRYRYWVLYYESVQRTEVYSVQCTVYSVQCTVYSVQCTVYSVQCTVYSVKCTVYSVQCTVYSVQCTVYSVQCTVYSVQCTVCSLQFTVYSAQYQGMAPPYLVAHT